MEPRRTSARTKADERDPSLVQADLDEIAADDKIVAFPPPPNKIPRVPSRTSPRPPSKPAHQRVVIGTPARRAMAEERRETKTCPPEPTYFETTSINLKPVTAGTIQRKPSVFQRSIPL